MSLDKVLATLVVAVGTHISLSGHPGTKGEPTKRKYTMKQTLPGILVWTQALLKSTCWTHTLIEILLLLSTYESMTWLQPAASFLLPGQHVEERIFLSPLGLIGASLIGFSAVLRSFCFRAMGANFTYHITIVDNHKLTTTGPYAFVRHPSYSGSYCHYMGYFLYFSASGSWLRESGAYKIKLVWLILVPLILRTLAAFRMFWRRLPLEDALMKKQFGKQWDEWAARVPYRLIPWVY